MLFSIDNPQEGQHNITKKRMDGCIGEIRLGTAVYSSSSCTGWAGWREEVQQPDAGAIKPLTAGDHTLLRKCSKHRCTAHVSRWGLVAFQVSSTHEQPIITSAQKHGGWWSRAFPRQVHDRFAPPRQLVHDACYISTLAHRKPHRRYRDRYGLN